MAVQFLACLHFQMANQKQEADVTENARKLHMRNRHANMKKQCLFVYWFSGCISEQPNLSTHSTWLACFSEIWSLAFQSERVLSRLTFTVHAGFSTAFLPEKGRGHRISTVLEQTGSMLDNYFSYSVFQAILNNIGPVTAPVMLAPIGKMIHCWERRELSLKQLNNSISITYWRTSFINQPIYQS